MVSVLASLYSNIRSYLYFSHNTTAHKRLRGNRGSRAMRRALASNVSSPQLRLFRKFTTVSSPGATVSGTTACRSRFTDTVMMFVSFKRHLGAHTHTCRSGPSAVSGGAPLSFSLARTHAGTCARMLAALCLSSALSLRPRTPTITLAHTQQPLHARAPQTSCAQLCSCLLLWQSIIC